MNHGTCETGRALAVALLVVVGPALCSPLCVLLCLQTAGYHINLVVVMPSCLVTVYECA